MAYNVKTIVERESMKYEMVRDHSIGIWDGKIPESAIIECHYNGLAPTEIAAQMNLPLYKVIDTVVETWAVLKRDAAFWKAVDGI